LLTQNRSYGGFPENYRRNIQLQGKVTRKDSERGRYREGKKKRWPAVHGTTNSIHQVHLGCGGSSLDVEKKRLRGERGFRRDGLRRGDVSPHPPEPAAILLKKHKPPGDGGRAGGEAIEIDSRGDRSRMPFRRMPPRGELA
jgi:hypothetical protein